MSNNLPFTFRVVSTGLRPAKVIVLIDRNDKNWIDICLRTIEWYSQMWGGGYNLIVPTDGKTISEEFWFLLEEFNPDYVYLYRKTTLDFKLSYPEEYSKWLERQAGSFTKQDPDSDEMLNRKFIDDQVNKGIDEWGHFDVSDTLQQEILRRLNPFSHRNRIIEGATSALYSVTYPLTSLLEIIPNTDLTEIVEFEFASEKAVQLMIYSTIGKLDGFRASLSKQLEELRSSRLLPEKEAKAKITALEQIQQKIVRHDFQENKLRDLLELIWTEGREPRESTEDFQYTPFSTKISKLGLYARAPDDNFKLLTSAPVVVVGDTVDDFCFYYNLYRLREDVYWVPTEQLKNFHETMTNRQKAKESSTPTEIIPFYLLVFELRNKMQKLKTNILMVSISEAENILEQVKDMLNNAEFVKLDNEKNIGDLIQTSKKPEELLPYTLHAFEINNEFNIYNEQFIQGESVNLINTPKPKNFSRVPPTGHYWISEINVQNFKLPLKPALAKLIVRHEPYTTHEMRISKYGIDYHCPNIGYSYGDDIDRVLVKPKLRLLDPFEIYRVIFEEAGYRIAYSDKGNFTRESISKFGSLEEIAKAFLNENHRSLLDKFIDKTPNKSGVYDKGVFLKQYDRRCLDFKSIKKIIGSEQEVKDLIEGFIEKKVFYRGFIFKCERCRNTDWYPIDEVTNTFKCKRCGFEQIYKSSHLEVQRERERFEPKWFYHLDEVFYQGYKHDMIVPILAFYKLQKSVKESFLFIPEIEVEKNGFGKSEIDICCISDGSIILGECKKPDRLEKTAQEEEKSIKRYKRLAEDIGTDKIVFATLSDSWREETKNKINQVLKDSRIGKELLTKSDLLDPHF
jgi:hypothetical protein